jgi:hypothetical protein
LGLIEQALDPGQNGLAAPEEQAAVAASNGRAGTAIGPIVRRFGERRALLLELGSRATGFLIFGVAPTGPLFWLGIPVMALWAVSGAAIQALLTQSALLIAARTLAIARVADISS